jgi:hypothetical protein
MTDRHGVRATLRFDRLYERSQRWLQQRGLSEEREAVRPYESIVQV